MTANIWHLVYRNGLPESRFTYELVLLVLGRMSSLPQATYAIARAKKAVNSQLTIILLAVVMGPMLLKYAIVWDERERERDTRER